jgi:prevent-host-death family protein
MPNLRVAEDIVPLSDFKARASELLKKLAETGAPMVITQNGRAAGVLLSPAEFDSLTERAQFVKAVAEGMEDLRSGRVVPHESMVAEVKSRYGEGEE